VRPTPLARETPVATGTIIQNWHASASSDTTAAGFGSLVSTYNQFYLDQQCCAGGPAAPSDGDHVKQCYWNDISQGVAPGNLGLLYGGGGYLI
jgi:hypothetical protein